MKRLKLIVVCLLCVFTALAQSEVRKSISPIGTFHQNNREINGLSFGAFSEMKVKNTNTNGVKLEVIGLGMLLPLVPLDSMTNDSFLKATISETVTGLSLSGTGTACNCKLNGLSLGGLNQLVTEVNGVSTVLGFNFVLKHKGVQLGTINRAWQMKGLQIGIFNYAKDLKGVQLGLWNVNQKRKTPFIGWNFKD